MIDKVLVTSSQHSVFFMFPLCLTNVFNRKGESKKTPDFTASLYMMDSHMERQFVRLFFSSSGFMAEYRTTACDCETLIAFRVYIKEIMTVG